MIFSTSTKGYYRTMKQVAKHTLRRFGFDILRYAPDSIPVDFSSENIQIIRRVRPYTGTSAERVNALIEAVRYIVKGNVPGDFAECGVYRGGSMMAVALALQQTGSTDKDLYLYDTFEGMTKPTEKDVNSIGQPAIVEFEQKRTGDDSSDWCMAPLDEVKKALYGTGYPSERIHFIKGRVEETIPESAPSAIALLRLDTDWYESTRHELIHLYPRLSRGGVLIIDDYGHWQGCREAVDEYIAQHNLTLMLHRIDYTGRVALKL